MPAREGTTASHKFAEGATGHFGEQIPGIWLSQEEALALYRKIFRHYRLFGDDGLLKRSRITGRVAHVLGAQNDWYDTHAAR